MNKLEISIIITAHHEGLFLQKTILSILESAKSLEKSVKYEILLNLDNPDSETRRVANLWSENPLFIISEVSFGNPADNRNDAIKKSQGKFITLLDGDDLVSSNWLKSAYDLAKRQDGNFIIRPEIHMQFGYEEEFNTIWHMRNSRSKQEDAIQMAYWNLWTNSIFTTKETLLKIPYQNPKNGFGFEDYLFGADTRAQGTPNIIAPETVLFYRRRNFSMTTLHRETILGYTDLLDIDFMKSIPLPAEEIKTSNTGQRLKNGFKKVYRFVFDIAKKSKILSKVLGPAARNILYKKKSQQVPDWIIREWKAINKIENQLWPTKGEIAKLGFHPLTLDPDHNSYGQVYQRICHELSDNHIDYLFLAPSMSGRGGTEKLIANYIKALQKNHPEWKIGILSTQPFNDLTLDYFKDLNIDMINFGKYTENIGKYERDIIWSRILVQTKVKRLHLVNDKEWYQWISKHQDLMIKNDYKIYVSLFMREFTHEKGRIQSFADPDLAEIWPTVTKVFTDNQRVIDDALENNAFEKVKMIAHYQPQDFDKLVAPKLINSKKPLRILWASRISHQKRPDILKKISQKLGDNFVIDAYGLIEKKQYNTNYFDSTKINYRGNFNGISSIDTAKYDAYLYTSQTDGVPNILLEVAEAGLPIVASDAGGVREVVKDGETGYLVDIEDIGGYISGLQQLASDPKSTQKMAENLQELVKKQHSWQKFTQNVKKDIG